MEAALFGETIRNQRQRARPPLGPEPLRYLGRHKVGGVTRRHQQAVLRSQLFGKAEVADPDGLGVPALVHVEDVAGLQVSVHHLQPQQGHESRQVGDIINGNIVRINCGLETCEYGGRMAKIANVNSHRSIVKSCNPHCF